MMEKMKGFVVVILLSVSGLAIAQHPQWGKLKPGQYPVGFRVISEFDYGRYTRPNVDFEGKRNTGELALPVQISMWYPAKSSRDKKPMLFEEYVYLTKQKNNFKPLTEAEKKASADVIRFPAKFAAGIELSEADILALFQTPTAAVQHAANADGTFPVIISGLDGGPSSSNVLYEYLASLGYVVLSTPSSGHVGTLQVNRPQVALAERIGNLEYLMRFAHQLPFADHARIGVLGINFDGMSALLFQMKNMQAEAIVSIDGWEGKEGTGRHLLESPFFEANKMRVPYFVVQQDEQNPRLSLRPTTTVFDTLVYSDRYHYELTGMNHGYLIANLGVLPQLTDDKRTAYHFLYSGIGHFFDAYLKSNKESLVFIKKSAAENGFPSTIIKSEVKAVAYPAVPTAEEFEKLVTNAEFDKITVIYREGKKFNPQLKMFDRQALNLYAFRFTQQKQFEKVLAIRLLAAEAFPWSAKVSENLGDAYMMVDNRDKARQSFEKAISLLDADTEIDAETKPKIKVGLKEKLKKM